MPSKVRELIRDLERPFREKRLSRTLCAGTSWCPVPEIVCLLPQVSWLFFKKRAKRRYLHHNGRASDAEKQPTGRGPRGCVENGSAGFLRLRDQSGPTPTFSCPGETRSSTRLCGDRVRTKRRRFRVSLRLLALQLAFPHKVLQLTHTARVRWP
jgi:hypothetical protein